MVSKTLMVIENINVINFQTHENYNPPASFFFITKIIDIIISKVGLIIKDINWPKPTLFFTRKKRKKYF